MNEGWKTMNEKTWLERILRSTDEKGAVLVTGLLFVLVLTLLSIAAMMSTATELKIAANDRSAKQIFYLAEAGLEDARSRMQTGASAFPISDTQPANTIWKAFIGTTTKAALKGYDSGNSSHFLYNRVNPPGLDYVVTVTHKLNSSGNILFWGDSNGDGLPEENTTVGKNIYVITSEGYDANGASKSIKIEASKFPSITADAALYTKAHTTIQGSSTYILGMDHCGSSNKPGIITMNDVTQNGGPNVTGSPQAIVENSTQNIDVRAVINQFASKVNYSYNLNSATLTGMNWGTPTPGATQQDASSCSSRNVVYFNTNSTYVKLRGGTNGCGILILDGDLAVNGGFQWYGAILVTGSVSFTGGGGKNVTGAMLAGGTASADLVGGDASIIYCSQAMWNQTEYLSLVTLRWAELFS
jgi:Tfp pilus assembly protein PilX